MWDLLGPGIEPLSPALAGGFLTAEPPEKSLDILSFYHAYLKPHFIYPSTSRIK